MKFWDGVKEIVRALYGQDDKSVLLEVDDLTLLVAILDTLTEWAEDSNPEYGYVSYSVADHLICLYQNEGGTAYQIDDGCLGSGTWVLYSEDDGLPTIVINERYITSWTSGHYIRICGQSGAEVEALLDCDPQTILETLLYANC